MKRNILILIICILFLSGCTQYYSTMSILPLKTIHNGTTLITEDYLYSVASGEVNSGTTWNKFGYNDDIDTGTDPELITSWGGDNSIFLSSAQILNISSTSSNDALGGTGAQSVLIYGIDENRLEQQELVFLNGTNTVQTTNQWLGVNRMVIYLGGTDQKNDGDITAITSEGGLTQAQVLTGLGTTQQAFFFTQANHTFLANYLVINANKLGSGATPKITIKGWSRSFVSNAEYEILRLTIDTAVENTLQLTPPTPFVLSQKEILYFTAETDTNNAIVTLRFSGIEKQN